MGLWIILPGIDDGSRNMDQSIQILKEAKEAGFSKVISTSHYMEEYFECDEAKRRELLDNLQKNIDGIDLYLGSEIYITNNIVDLIKENSASSLTFPPHKSHFSIGIHLIDCFTHWLSLNCLNAFSSPGFCCADSQAALTLSSATVIPSDGFAFLHTFGSVQSSLSSAP